MRPTASRHSFAISFASLRYAGGVAMAQSSTQTLRSGIRTVLLVLMACLLLPKAGLADEPFSLVFASDPQYRYLDLDNENPISDSEFEYYAGLQVSAIQELVSGSSSYRVYIDYDDNGSYDPNTDYFVPPMALIANGDITNTSRWSEFDAWNDKYRDEVGIPTYFGLGNHDYENDATACGALGWDHVDWYSLCLAQSSYTLWGEGPCTVAQHMIVEGQNWCAKDALRRMKWEAQNNVPNLVSLDDSSAAYAFDLQGIRFIQLQNYPTYENSSIGVESSIDWLKERLLQAAEDGRYVVINMHNLYYTSSDFMYATMGYEDIILGIFGGHDHEYAGYGGYVGGKNDLLVGRDKMGNEAPRTIPKFYGGGTACGGFALAQWDDNGMTVAAISNKDGVPESHLAFDTSDDHLAYDPWDPNNTGDGVSLSAADPVTIPWPSGKVRVTWKNHDEYTWTNAVGGTTGRYVTVYLPTSQPLSLAEVEVYSNGQNVAQGKSTSQSSTSSSGASSRAVDGNTSGTYNNGSVTHTDIGQSSWWRVDLGQRYEIDEIVVYNRTDCCTSRLDDAVVKISDDVFSAAKGGSGGSTFSWDTNRTLGVYPTTVIIRTGSRMEALEVVDTNGGGSSSFGGDGGSINLLAGLGDEEYIDYVRVCATDMVDYIEMRTNMNRVLSGGNQSGSTCTTLVDGHQVVGFYGASGSMIDKLGVIYESFTVTPWLDRDDPSGTGDWETISDHYSEGNLPCSNPIGIEARRISDERPAEYSFQYYANYDLSTGFKCKNDENSSDCDDYEVRYYCE